MVSVCLATYNGERYIKSQIESILNQLSIHDELIISDDQSKDKTILLIEQIKDKRIKIFTHKKVDCKTSSSFATKNFENALSKSKGDIIILSDQDDVWLPNKIEVMSKYLKSCDMVISDAYVTDSELRIIHSTRFFPGCGQTRNLLKAYVTTHPFQGSCMAFNRKVLSMALPFPKYVSSHDTWIGYIGTTFFKTKLISEKLIYYRRHENVVSLTGEKSKRPMIYRLFTRMKYLSLVLLRGFKLI